MVEPTLAQERRSSLGVRYEDIIQTNNFLPLQQDGVKPKLRNGVINGPGQLNGLSEKSVENALEAEVLQAKEIEKLQLNIIQPPQLNGFSTHSQDPPAIPSNEIPQRNLPKNDPRNGYESSSFVKGPSATCGSSDPGIDVSISGSSSDVIPTITEQAHIAGPIIPQHILELKGSSTLANGSTLGFVNSLSLTPNPTAIAAANNSTPSESFMPASTRLRQIIAHSPEILVCPGVYDGLSARIAHSVGFAGLYMTGAGTTASRLGAADLGIAQLHDMRTNAEMIANLCPGGSGPPLIADMDTGYGGPLIISRAVQAYVQAGVAGFHIEDQVAQKRCGHLPGKEVVDVSTFLQRIKACVIARARLRSDIVIIARTDAYQSCGYAECIQRLKRARDEGADVGILEGLASKEQARQAVRDLAPWPLCLNSVENGVSPLISVSEAQEMGFKIIIFSFAALAPAYVAIKQTFELLKSQGVTGTPKNISPKTIFQVCGLDEEVKIDTAIGGTAFAKGV